MLTFEIQGMTLNTVFLSTFFTNRLLLGKIILVQNPRVYLRAFCKTSCEGWPKQQYIKS